MLVNRRTFAIVIAITLMVGLCGAILLKDRLWPQQVACTPPPTYIPDTPLPTTSPLAPAATQLWGKAALETQVPIVLPNGHDLAYLQSLPDGSVLMGEAETCGASWVSAFTVATGTTRHLCTVPDGPGKIADGRYMAWITGDGYTGLGPVPHQRVGYIDIATCKITNMFDYETPVVDINFAVSHGYFIWAKGTIHMTNMATGVTKNLVAVGTPRQIVWPYLLYQEYSNGTFTTNIYNLETDQATTIPSVNPTPYNATPTLTAGPTVYWQDKKGKIQEIDHADRPDAQTHVAFTVKHGSSRNIQITDRLFIWEDGSYLYAWDRVLNKETVLPAAVVTYGLPNYPYRPQIFGNVIVLTSYGAEHQVEYLIIDTARLPTIVTS